MTCILVVFFRISKKYVKNIKNMYFLYIYGSKTMPKIYIFKVFFIIFFIIFLIYFSPSKSVCKYIFGVYFWYIFGIFLYISIRLGQSWST